MLHTIDIANATHDEIRQAAYQRGHDIATWQDTPALGTELSPSVDWIGIDTVDDADDQREALDMMANEAESNERQFSPNEVWISAINARADADEVWDIVEEGLREGIQAEIASRNLRTYYVYANYGYASENLLGTFTDLDEARDLADSEADADEADGEAEDSLDRDDDRRKIEVVTFSDSGEVNTEYMP